MKLSRFCIFFCLPLMFVNLYAIFNNIVWLARVSEISMFITLFIGFFVIYISRRNPSSQICATIAIAIAFLLITAYPVKIIGRFIDGIEINKDVIFPLQLCDVAAIAGFFALILKNRLCAEITYFFGLAGTLQALFTPSTCYDFPTAFNCSYCCSVFAPGPLLETSQGLSNACLVLWNMLCGYIWSF